jgi:hypothetical protein
MAAYTKVATFLEKNNPNSTWKFGYVYMLMYAFIVYIYIYSFMYARINENMCVYKPHTCTLGILCVSFGTYIHIRTNTHAGKFVRDLRHGCGSVVCKELCYHGGWAGGLRHGSGIESYTVAGECRMSKGMPACLCMVHSCVHVSSCAHVRMCYLDASALHVHVITQLIFGWSKSCPDWCLRIRQLRVDW